MDLADLTFTALGWLVSGVLLFGFVVVVLGCGFVALV